MRRIFFITFIILISVSLQAQVAPYKYYIQFTDKNNSPYSLDHPEVFLTQRAIARRLAHNIPLSENDIPVNPQYIQGVAATGAEILNATRWFNGVTVYTTDSTVLSAIAALPYVDHVVLASHPNGESREKIYFKNESTSNNIPLHANKHFKNGNSYDYGYAYNQINQINGIGLHNLGYRGQGMVIAVLDAGYVGVQTQPLFDSLWANNQILGTKDFVHPGGNVFTEASHGREVLSCMGANIPGLMIGTAPKASYWLLRSEDINSENVIEEYNWVSAAEFADSVGADIINSSLGYINFDNPAFNHPYSDMDGNTCVSSIGADIAASKGILVTNSAGNSGGNYTFPWIGAPADGDSVFTIGAVDGNGNRASFSSIGPTYDGRIKPTVMAKGLNATVANNDTSVMEGSGTSFSSPIMAGMTACLWQAYPQFNNMEIIKALKQSGSTADNPNNYMGWGIPDFMNASSIITKIILKTRINGFVTASPNPFINHLKLEFKIKNRQKFNLILRNTMGANLFSKTITVSDSNNSVYLYGIFNNLTSGVYFLEVSGSNKFQTLKLIKENN